MRPRAGRQAGYLDSGSGSAASATGCFGRLDADKVSSLFVRALHPCTSQGSGEARGAYWCAAGDVIRIPGKGASRGSSSYVLRLVGCVERGVASRTPA